MRMITKLLPLLAGALLVVSLPVAADDAPDEMVRNAVERMTDRIDQEREQLEKNPDYARQLVDQEMDSLVDFRRITRAVMAEHFASASREQRQGFLKAFRSSLINTYASGITLYDGQPWSILPMQDGDLRGDRARVQMEIRTEAGQRIPIVYTLFQGDDGWRVDNVIVNGLNLGRVFRAQFAQAMSQHGGDIDKVIANWSAEVPAEREDLIEGGDEA